MNLKTLAPKQANVSTMHNEVIFMKMLCAYILIVLILSGDALAQHEQPGTLDVVREALSIRDYWAATRAAHAVLDNKATSEAQRRELMHLVAEIFRHDINSPLQIRRMSWYMSLLHVLLKSKEPNKNWVLNHETTLERCEGFLSLHAVAQKYGVQLRPPAVCIQFAMAIAGGKEHHPHQAVAPVPVPQWINGPVQTLGISNDGEWVLLHTSDQSELLLLRFPSGEIVARRNFPGEINSALLNNDQVVLDLYESLEVLEIPSLEHRCQFPFFDGYEQIDGVALIGSRIIAASGNRLENLQGDSCKVGNPVTILNKADLDRQAEAGQNVAVKDLRVVDHRICLLAEHGTSSALISLRADDLAPEGPVRWLKSQVSGLGSDCSFVHQEGDFIVTESKSGSGKLKPPPEWPDAPIWMAMENNHLVAKTEQEWWIWNPRDNSIERRSLDLPETSLFSRLSHSKWDGQFAKNLQEKSVAVPPGETLFALDTRWILTSRGRKATLLHLSAKNERPPTVRWRHHFGGDVLSLDVIDGWSAVMIEESLKELKLVVINPRGNTVWETQFERDSAPEQSESESPWVVAGAKGAYLLASDGRKTLRLEPNGLQRNCRFHPADMWIPNEVGTLWGIRASSLLSANAMCDQPSQQSSIKTNRYSFVIFISPGKVVDGGTWSSNLSAIDVVQGEGKIILGDEDGNVFEIDETSRSVILEYQGVPELISSIRAEDDKSVFWLTNNGNLLLRTSAGHIETFSVSAVQIVRGQAGRRRVVVTHGDGSVASYKLKPRGAQLLWRYWMFAPGGELLIDYEGKTKKGSEVSRRWVRERHGSRLLR